MNNDQLNEARFARNVCGALNRGAAGMTEKTTARLHAARQAALARQAEPAPVMSLAGVGHGIGDFGHFVADSLHHHYRGILAVLALLVGAMGAQVWQNAQQAVELAEIDSALLSDDVPPGAYTDQGFLEWLEHFSSDERQDGSLPQ